jgi:hypothetical protein
MEENTAAVDRARAAFAQDAEKRGAWGRGAGKGGGVTPCSCDLWLVHVGVGNQEGRLCIKRSLFTQCATSSTATLAGSDLQRAHTHAGVHVWSPRGTDAAHTL